VCPYPRLESDAVPCQLISCASYAACIIYVLSKRVTPELRSLLTGGQQISGFRRGVVRSAFFWDVTRTRLVVAYQRIGTAYRSCLRDVVSDYQRTAHNIPEERRSQLVRSKEDVEFLVELRRNV
jgi:hypothetical protein